VARPQTAHLRRPEILAAATDVLRERGVNATRIADVADRIGASAPSILYYFESKEELLREALTFAEERFYDELEGDLTRISSARERLVWLVESCLTEGDYDAVLWIELWPHALRSEEVAVTRETLDRRWRGAIASIVREGQRRGEFSGGDPEELTLLVSSLLYGLMIQVAMQDSEMTPSRAREMCLGVLERELGCALVGKRPPAGLARESAALMEVE
jgi:AcrR family transcriptional regulator